MDLQQSDFDRILFFEHARKTAEATHAKNPPDADVRFSAFLLFSPSNNCYLLFTNVF